MIKKSQYQEYLGQNRKDFLPDIENSVIPECFQYFSYNMMGNDMSRGKSFNKY